MRPRFSAYSLVCHTDDSAGGVDSVEAEVRWQSPTMRRLLFRVSGDAGGLRIPKTAEPARCDGLWRHTCFEMFFADGGERYFEFNFSPSLQWAAYQFDSYRKAMADLQLPSPPRIHVETLPDAVILDVLFEIPESISPRAGERSRMALAAIIETRAGDVSHWALAHPAGKPDFHHPDSFVGVLPDNGA